MAKVVQTLPANRAAGMVAAMIVFLADQILKWIVIVPLALKQRQVIEVLPVFHLKWMENRGVSMGLLTADTSVGRWLLVALTAAIAAGAAAWMWREKQRSDAVALGLVLGGALGNILDRVRFGYVVDFLGLHFGSWYPFLIFNVADAAITIGVLIVLLRALLSGEKRAPVEK